ncbi:MAG: hypothetical protein OSA41_05645 [Erythrobacter sp.]|jgi:hypothetical protein|nr:hypothetical protein [Erythrobacter sp.]|tara:strand:- start:266190 stop:266423 length:234 start_codon:yes stop_codon:yes gene_type:complete
MGSRAEQLRHHRKCFEYGLQHGISPREAELQMKLQEARDRAQTLQARMTAKHHAQCVAPARIASAEEPKPEPWMMRD